MSGEWLHLHSMHCDDRKPGETYVAVGTVATQKGADAGYALPFAFPYTGLFATGNRGTSGYNAAMNVRIASRTHISIQNWSPSGEGTEDCCFIALGY